MKLEVGKTYSVWNKSKTVHYGVSQLTSINSTYANFSDPIAGGCFYHKSYVFEEIMDPQVTAVSAPRSIEEIHASLVGNGGKGGYPTDQEVMHAQQFYNDLCRQLMRCPDLKGVRMVAIDHELTFRRICQARGLPVS